MTASFRTTSGPRTTSSPRTTSGTRTALRPTPVVSPPGAVAGARHWRRWATLGAAFGAAGLALLVPTSTAGVTWFFTGQLLGAESEHPYPVRVRRVSAGQIALSRTEDLARDIPLSLVWPGGHARLGAILDQHRATIVREVTEVSRGSLRPGLRGYTSGQLFDGDPATARGLAYSEVVINGELGPLPAWLVPPTAPAGDTWLIAVHGRGGSRGEALRVLPTIAASGLPALVVTYRNDPEAPPSPDRCYHLGGTEWCDVAAAIRYARASGARDVVLYGWSMGGAIVLNLLRQAPEATDVRAVVLDSPVVDWLATLRMHARALNVPRAWTWTTTRLIQRRLGVTLTDLDHRRYAGDLRVPVLMFVDHDDETVCPTPSIQYATRRPDLVTLVETVGAGHCRSWNRDPRRYEDHLARFLARVTA